MNRAGAPDAALFSRGSDAMHWIGRGGVASASGAAIAGSLKIARVAAFGSDYPRATVIAAP